MERLPHAMERRMIYGFRIDLAVEAAYQRIAAQGLGYREEGLTMRTVYVPCQSSAEPGAALTSNDQTDDDRCRIEI